MNDRLSALKPFARAARVGNFSSAGRELGLSQPSASRLIAALEEEVGATLFSRTTRAVTLTEAGATYLMRVEAILAALDDERGTPTMPSVSAARPPFGESPMSLLRRVRMRHAADLLTANALSIEQIASRHVVECKGSSA